MYQNYLQNRRLKQTLRDRFDNEKTGDKNLCVEQKKYKPLLTSQQEI